MAPPESSPVTARRTCVCCGSDFAIVELLDHPSHFWPEVGVLACATPCCGDREELQLLPGLVLRGYVYAAGTAHFAAVERYAAPELQVQVRGRSLWFRNGEGPERLVATLRAEDG